MNKKTINKKIYIDKEQVLDNEYALSEIEEVVFSSKVKYLGNRAFFRCAKLNSIIFEGNAIEMGYECFLGCKSLKNIKLPRMTHIPLKCFYDAALEEIEFPNNLIVIDAYAFRLCKFKKLDFPESLKSIGSYAFSCGGNLKTIDFKNVEHLGDGAFSCCSIEEFKIGRTISRIPCYCFSRCNLKYVEILEAVIPNALYEYRDNVVQLDDFSFSQNPYMTIKLPNVGFTDRTFFVTDNPWFNVFLKDPYENMKILLPDGDDIDDEYHDFVGYTMHVTKYKTTNNDKKDETI